MLRFSALLGLLFTLIALTTVKAEAVSIDPQNYKRAFTALNGGKSSSAFDIITRGRDPILNKVLRGYYMAAPGNNVSFAEMSEFIRKNPDWPNLRDIRSIAEQKIPSSATPDDVIDWFSSYPPVTLIGFYRYVDALNMKGQAQTAIEAIKTRWIEGSFRDEELGSFYTRFGAYLTRDDHWARLDRLLWNQDAANARRLYSLVDPNMRIVAEARLALGSQKFGAAKYLEHVPSDWQSDSGLLYERLRWLRRENRDEDAIDILEHPPVDLVRPDAWWEEREILIRRTIEKRNFDLAYRLAANHGQIDTKGRVHAEFLAGWLALRFIHQPEAAREHFEALYQHATTPISRARGAYWLGRSLEVLDNKVDAEQAYETAATLNTTFYGQLAMTRLYAEPIITAWPEPKIPSLVRTKFYQRDSVRAVERLHQLGEEGRVRTFFKAIVDTSTARVDFALLSELAYQIQRPDLAIEAAKAANQKNIIVAAGGFPLLSTRVPNAPEPAFIHAVIRQESMFNPEAASPAGAHGLMQLMPPTAKAMAQKIGVKFKPRSLVDPDYNLRLGSAFVQNQIDSFGGSYVLALAGYNAGPTRVREWMGDMGDPRNSNIDPIDWIELIPMSETRNYVQRILENLQIYRARLNGGKAPLLILKDLKR
jgi:soluble lytic murein transglycosylase